MKPKNSRQGVTWAIADKADSALGCGIGLIIVRVLQNHLIFYELALEIPRMKAAWCEPVQKIRDHQTLNSLQISHQQQTPAWYTTNSLIH